MEEPVPLYAELDEQVLGVGAAVGRPFDGEGNERPVRGGDGVHAAEQVADAQGLP